MSGKYFIFSIRRSAAAAVYAVVLLFVAGVLVSPSNGIPVASPEESASVPSTTVKILIPPSSIDDTEDDAVVIEAGNGTNSPLPREPFHPNDYQMEKSKGPCRAIIDMWFLNPSTKTCEQFQYSGCGGNGNRFAEQTECENLCGMNSKNNNKADDEEEDDTVVIDAESNNGTCPEFDGCGPLKCAVIKDEKTGCQKCACSLIPEDDEKESKLPVGSVSGKPSEEEDECISPLNRNAAGVKSGVAGGNNNFFGEPRSKEDLDKELEAYMSKSKGKMKNSLDNELEEYMKVARQQSFAARIGILASTESETISLASPAPDADTDTVMEEV